jgi:hypothetical protein
MVVVVVDRMRLLLVAMVLMGLIGRYGVDRPQEQLITAVVVVDKAVVVQTVLEV